MQSPFELSDFHPTRSTIEPENIEQMMEKCASWNQAFAAVTGPTIGGCRV